MSRWKNISKTLGAIALLLALSLSPLAQTRITPPKNPYKPAQDVELGRQASAEVAKQTRVLNDDEVQRYIERIGRRLVNNLPPQFQFSEFEYSFKVVEAKDINAFALPGGFTYINSGLIEVAKTEGELAGVMAHEISHVALRHGTAQVAQGRKYQIGAIAGTILGSIIGGGAGTAIAQGSQLGFGAYLLKFSREYERQADLLGAQMMAAAGYDPRDLANMFQTIEKASGGRGGPEWLSSHPNPGNRYNAINKEAQALQIGKPPRNTGDFSRIQERVRYLAKSSTQPSSGRLGRVDPPSSRMRTYRGGQVFQISIPQNWRELAGQNSVTFAPEGGYGQAGEQSVFTHGVLAGLTKSQSRNLNTATENFISQLAESNPDLRQQGRAQYTSIDRRDAITVPFSNRSEATGKNESIDVYTTLLSDGTLFYVITVAPADEYRQYRNLFLDIVDSIRLQ